jgi:hypothetical protein
MSLSGDATFLHVAHHHERTFFATMLGLARRRSFTSQRGMEICGIMGSWDRGIMGSWDRGFVGSWARGLIADEITQAMRVSITSYSIL